MSELRWSLLALGVLFIVGLLVWERRRRGGSVRSADAVVPAERSPAPDADLDPREAPEGLRESVDGTAAPVARREPVREPPIVEIVDPGVEGLTDGPDVVSLPVVAVSRGPEIGAAAVERAAQWLAESQPALQRDAGSPRPRMRLDWPYDASRRIIALRVVARAGERLTGGAVRQALQGEGFEHGEFGIFHLPLVDGRVLLSAANLTKPGSFLLEKMDTERLFGLNVFAVLPGPLGPTETFDRLYAVAGTLAQRLRGELRDTQGQPLSPSRVVELRREAQGVAAPGPST
jgi:FtsZ-interacting cell division protein ZipA